MSLNWDVTNVKDFQTKFPDHVDEDGRKEWNGKFMCLLYYNMFTDMGEVTKENHVEFYERIKIYDKMAGCISTKGGVDYPLTYQDVADIIGLSINVSFEKRTAYMKKMNKRIQDDVKRAVTRELLG